MSTLNYDKKYDILYIKLSNTNNSIGFEDEPGIVIFKDRLSGDITGITLFDFKKRLERDGYKNIDLPIDLSDKNVYSFIMH